MSKKNKKNKLHEEFPVPHTATDDVEFIGSAEAHVRSLVKNGSVNVPAKLVKKMFKEIDAEIHRRNKFIDKIEAAWRWFQGKD